MTDVATDTAAPDAVALTPAYVARLAALLREASETIHGRQQRDPSLVSAECRAAAALLVP